MLLMLKKVLNSCLSCLQIIGLLLLLVVVGKHAAYGSQTLVADTSFKAYTGQYIIIDAEKQLDAMVFEKAGLLYAKTNFGESKLSSIGIDIFYLDNLKGTVQFVRSDKQYVSGFKIMFQAVELEAVRADIWMHERFRQMPILKY